MATDDIKLNLSLDTIGAQRALGHIETMVKDAHEAGKLSDERARDIAADPLAILAVEVANTYSEDRQKIRCQLRVEPTAAFLAEIGLSPF